MQYLKEDLFKYNIGGQNSITHLINLAFGRLKIERKIYFY